MRKPIRVSATADWHVYDWNSYSTYDAYGRPNRLTNYIDLAKAFVRYSRDMKANVRVLAGDIAEAPVLSPRVLEIISDCIDIICEDDSLVIMIPGQHDLDAKISSIAKHNTVLKSLIKGSKKGVLFYVTEPQVIQYLGGWDILVSPWNSEFKVPDQQADVFVGHGIISTSTGPNGYQFISGFDPSQLLQRFKASIIGDIHKRQKWQSKESIVLVPGAPIQNSWKDEADCGFSTLEVTEEGATYLDYTNVHDLEPNKFPQFLYREEDEPTLDNQLIHYRIKSKGKKKDKKDTKIVNVGEHFREVINNTLKKWCSDNDKDLETYSLHFKEVLDNFTFKGDKSVPPCHIDKIQITNFLSIEDLEVDFNCFPKTLVLQGRNGSGKTSVVEAIYWCLTGKLTKSGVSVKDVTRWETEFVRVKTYLTVNDSKMVLERSRSGSPKLTIATIDKYGEEIPFNENNTAKTQDTIHEILGLSHWEISALSYFSSTTPMLFGELSSSNRNELIAHLTNLSEIDNLVDKFKEFLEKAKNETAETRGKVSFLETKIINLKGELEESLKENSIQSELKKLYDSRDQLTPKVDALNIDSIRDREMIAREALSTIRRLIDLNGVAVKKYSEFQGQYEVRKKQLQADISKIRSGVCPTCGQSFHNDRTLESYISQLDTLENILKETKETSDKAEIENSSVGRKILPLEDSLKKTQRTLDFARSLKNELDIVNVKIRDIELTPNVRLPVKIQEDIDKHVKDSEGLNEIYQANIARQEILYDIANKYLRRNGPLYSAMNAKGASTLKEEVNELLKGSDINIDIKDDLSLLAFFPSMSKQTEYNSLSNGQRRILDIALIVGLNNVFSAMYHLEKGVLGLLILDEVLAYLDDNHVDIAISILEQTVASKAIVITHDIRVASYFDSKIRVEMDENSISRYSFLGDIDTEVINEA